MTTRSLSESIKPLKARRERTRPKKTEPGRSLPALFARERLETRILPYLETLREAIPLPAPHRRLYDGAWVIGLSGNFPNGTFADFAKRYICIPYIEKIISRVSLSILHN